MGSSSPSRGENINIWNHHLVGVFFMVMKFLWRQIKPFPKNRTFTQTQQIPRCDFCCVVFRMRMPHNRIWKSYTWTSQEVSKRLGSVGYFTPMNPPFVSGWTNPLIQSPLIHPLPSRGTSKSPIYWGFWFASTRGRRMGSPTPTPGEPILQVWVPQLGTQSGGPNPLQAKQWSWESTGTGTLNPMPPKSPQENKALGSGILKGQWWASWPLNKAFYFLEVLALGVHLDSH